MTKPTPAQQRVLILPVPPSANRYWRSYRGITVTSGEALAYKKEAGYLARQAGVQVLEGDVVIRMDFYRARKAGDLDNRIKCLLDALNGIAYKDDSQIVEIHARRFDDKANPRVEVTVTASGQVAVNEYVASKGEEG